MLQTAALHDPTHITAHLGVGFSYIHIGGQPGSGGVRVFFDDVRRVQAFAAALAEAISQPGEAVRIGEWL